MAQIITGATINGTTCYYVGSVPVQHFADGRVICTQCNGRIATLCRHAVAITNRLAAPDAATKTDRVLARLARSYK